MHYIPLQLDIIITLCAIVWTWFFLLVVVYKLYLPRYLSCLIKSDKEKVWHPSCTCITTCMETQWQTNGYAIMVDGQKPVLDNNVNRDQIVYLRHNKQSGPYLYTVVQHWPLATDRSRITVGLSLSLHPCWKIVHQHFMETRLSHEDPTPTAAHPPHHTASWC